MTEKFTLVPSELFSEETARETLSEVVLLEEGEPLSFLDIPFCQSVLVYAGQRRPAVYDMLMSLCKIRHHNKIMASISDDVLSLVVAQGDRLQFCNCFKAGDFTTALYYIFMVLKKLQINPEISTLYFTSGDISQEQLTSLFRYFKSAEVLQ